MELYYSTPTFPALGPVGTDSIWHRDTSQRSRLAVALESHHVLVNVQVSIDGILGDEVCKKIGLHDMDGLAAIDR